MDLNNPPFVSVLMTAYNREKYIAEAIESVLNSTYKNFELIIVDDASVDNTVSIAREFELKDSRIKVYVNQKNLGQWPNRNFASKYAKGHYIKYLDSDDTIYNWGLAYCVELMEKYPESGMGIFQGQNKVKEEYLIPKDAVNKHFFENSFLNIGPSGIILKKDAFEKIGRYSPDYGVPSDMYFNIKMASLYPIVMLKKEFFFYREHEGQEFRNEYSYVCYNYKYLHDALQIPGFPLSKEQKNYFIKKAKRSFVRTILIYLRDTGNVRKAIKAYRLSGIGFIGFLRGIFQ